MFKKQLLIKDRYGILYGMDCPKCRLKNRPKDGIVREKQRYFCRNCDYHFINSIRGKPADLKRTALHLYLEGLTLREIAKYLKVSNVTIHGWIIKYGKNLKEIIKPRTHTKLLIGNVEFALQKEAFTDKEIKEAGLPDVLVIQRLGKNIDVIHFAE